MKKCRKARKIAALLAGILVLESFQGIVLSYIDTYAYTEKPAIVQATSLNVRSGPGTSYSIVTKLTNGASVTVLDESSGSDGALWYKIRFVNAGGQEVKGYVSKSYLQFPVSYTSDADFEAKLTMEGFPESYKARLRALHTSYPQWVFRAQHTNLDFNTAVKEESKAGKTLVHTSSMSSWKSVVDGAYNWDTSTWVGYDGSAWVTASEEIVKYYMDPRNFLDETNVFQFLSHAYNSSSHKQEGLETMIKGTFLSGQTSGGGSAFASSSSGQNAPADAESGKASLEAPGGSAGQGGQQAAAPEYGPGASSSGSGASSSAASGGSLTLTGTGSYVAMIMNAASQSGVNPYVLAAMILQEQGAAGTGKSISGTMAGYEGFYNFFNIEAYQSGNMSAVQRGLWWASQSGSYERPWNTAEKAILGGAYYYGNNYVKVGQDTFYLKKFNVQGNELYKHQYMTNVQAAAAEGSVYAKAYNAEMKRTALEFKIPVYLQMPDGPCSQPAGDGNPNNKLSSLSVEGYSITPTFSRNTQEYNLIVDASVTGIKVKASVLESTASISGTGNISLQNGGNDIKVQVTAQNGTVRQYLLHVVRGSGGFSSPGTVTGTDASVEVGVPPGGNGSGSGSLGNPGSSFGPGSFAGGSSSGSGSSGGSGVSGNGSSGSSNGGSSGSASSGSSLSSGSSDTGTADDTSNSGPGVVNKSSSTGNSNNIGSSNDTNNSAAQKTGGPGQSNADLGTPGGSNVTIIPDKEPGVSVSIKIPAQVIKEGAGSLGGGSTGNSGQTAASLSGDVNEDGTINSLDALRLQRYLLGQETLSEKGKKAADLNGDGKVNSQDLALLKKKLLEI